MTETRTITVSILDKDYQVSCPDDEVDALRRSASYVDDKMREIKSGSGVFGLDRIAVMTALNVANDYIRAVDDKASAETETARQLDQLDGKLDGALDRLRAHRIETKA